MNKESIAARFEQTIKNGPKASVIESAYAQDIIWINVANIYGFLPDEQATLRAYIRKTYHADGRRIAV